jgi:ferrochelatase
VLTTYGEPPTPAFAAHLRYSWRILLGLTRTVAPIPPIVLPFIALKRGWTRNRVWRRAGYQSPLEAITRDQQAGVLAQLRARAPGHDWRVHTAYEFREPSLQQILRTIAPEERVTVAPMYVTVSAFTHELSRRTAASCRADRGTVIVLPPLDPALLAARSAAWVRRVLHERGHRPDHRWALVLAAHGTLLEPPRPIETGREATEELSRAIARELESDFGLIVHGWLNHTAGGRWTEPPIEEALLQVERAGWTKVAYFPYGFVADNSETELEGRLALGARPRLEPVMIPCLNDEPSYLEAVAAAVIASAGIPARSGSSSGDPQHVLQQSRIAVGE